MKDHGKGTGTDNDRSAAYNSDLLVRTIEDFMRKLRPEQRLYPDIYAERLATAIRKAGFTL